MKLKIDKNISKRIISFVSSDLWKNLPSHSKTQYWEHHANLLSQFKMGSDYVEIQGVGGFNIPNEKYSLNALTRPLKSFIKQLFSRDKLRFLSFSDAFQRVIKENLFAGYQQVKFDKEKIIASNYSQIKKIYPFNYDVNDPNIILSYYYINILNSYIDFSNTKYIAEIGGGSGNLMSLLKYHNKPKCIVNIDLPEVLIVCIIFLTNIFPKANFLFPNEVNKKITSATLSNYDFIFLTPSQLDFLDDNLFDLFINTISFQEMEKNQIKEYFNLIQRSGKKNSYFFNQNRVEKLPFDSNDDNKKSSIENIKPTRFCEYPFFNNEIKVFEICKFSSLVKRGAVYTRLEKILKN